MEYLRDGPLARLWEAAAFKNELSVDTVSHVDINATIEALKSAKNLPLPIAGELLHAMSKVLNSSAGFALEDAKETNRELYNTFKEQMSANDGGETERATTAAPPMTTGLELGTLSLPDSLIGRRQQAALQDISIDAIVREDRSMDANPLEEGPDRSAEDLAALEALDLGDIDDVGEIDASNDGGMLELPSILDSEAGLDFGSDEQRSSSPPHTPQTENDVDVRIGGSSPVPPQIAAQPIKRATKRRGAPVDDVISIQRPKRPSTQILRQPNDIGTIEAGPFVNKDAQLIPLDDATERLIDPTYVQAEMKRRRTITEGPVEARATVSGESEPVADSIADMEVGNDFEADWGADADFDDQPSPIESSFEEADDDVDTAEVLKEGAAAAKAVLHSHLKRKGASVMFDDIATSATTRADMLMEVLVLAAQGRAIPHQDEAWGPIRITQV